MYHFVSIPLLHCSLAKVGYTRNQRTVLGTIRCMHDDDDWITMKLTIIPSSPSSLTSQYLYVPIKKTTMPYCPVVPRPTKLARILVIMCAKRPNMHVHTKILPDSKKDHNKNKDNQWTFLVTTWLITIVLYLFFVSWATIIYYM